MLFDLRVLMISSWEASPNCLVRFSDMLCRPKPSLRNAGSGSFGSGLRDLRGRIRESSGKSLRYESVGTFRLHPLVLGAGQLFGPRRRGVGGEGHVVVGAGRGLVGEVRREQRRPVVLDDHRVVLRHVDGGRELVVSCSTNRCQRLASSVPTPRINADFGTTAAPTGLKRAET